MRKILLAVVLLTCASGAYAADIPLKAPPIAPPAPTWTGWYIGINGGGVWGTDTATLTNLGPDSFFAPGNVPAVTAGGGQPTRLSGGLGGGQVGFLYQAGRTIFGLEAGYDWTGLRGSRTVGPTLYPLNAPTTFTWNNTGKQDGLFTLLGRIGIDMGSWYPYLTGGVAVARLTHTANYVETFYPTNVTTSFSKDVAGGAVGGGLEYRFADHWLLRGEYLYTQFNNFTAQGLIVCTAGVGACAAGVPNQTTFRYVSSFNESIARIALSYKF